MKTIAKRIGIKVYNLKNVGPILLPDNQSIAGDALWAGMPWPL